MTDITERLRSGKGADRELDWDIHLHFWPHGSDYRPGKGDYPAYCSDLNAVFALVDRELPGAEPYLNCFNTDKTWVKWMLRSKAEQLFYSGSVYGPWLDVSVNCRALLLALLDAKNARS